MVNIAVVESTEFLKIRLINIIKKSGFAYAEINEKALKDTYNYDPFFSKSNLVVLDMDNKELDILAIVRGMKASEATKDIPIVVLSSQADFKLLKEAIVAGCSDFITKPFSAESFLEKMYKHASNVPYTILDGAFKNEEVDAMPDNVKFEWSEDFELGLKEIDEEHSSIVENFEKLYKYMKDGKGHEYYLELVEFLNNYVENHFAHEEAFQKKIGYDKIAEHRAIHDEFKAKVQDIIEDSKNHEINNMDLIKLNLFIKDWLINHILIEDKKIADFLEKNKTDE